MTKLILNGMHIENFMGIKAFDVKFNGNTDIAGMNGAGKSTLAKAVSWVLYNKDTEGNAPGSDAFCEKPCDAEGHEIHNLTTVVELDFSLDEKPFVIRREQEENWVKKRNAVQPTYSGNISKYWINSVECKQAEVKERLAEIVQEDVFRLLGSVGAFNALPWKQQREQLIRLADADIDGELLIRPEYRPLADECASTGNGVDDVRKILQDRRKLINDQLKAIPIRIDEARKLIPEVSANELADATYYIEDAKKDLENIESKLAELAAGDVNAEIRAKIRNEEASLVRVRADIESEHRRKVNDAASACMMAEQKLNMMRTQMESEKSTIPALKASIEADKKELDLLRAEYKKVFDRKAPEMEVSTVCPTCGQELPESQIEEAQERALAQFKEERHKALDSLKARGTSRSEAIEKQEKRLQEAEKRYEELENNLSACEADAAAARQAYDAVNHDIDYSSSAEIAGIEDRIENLKIQFGEGSDAQVRALRERKAELENRIDRNNQVLVRKRVGDEASSRIEELTRQQKDAADRLADTESLIALAESFLRERCNVLEESINEKFDTLRWKLFDTQINGGIVDTCMCMIPCKSGLIPYGSANKAAKTNADIEISGVLSELYGVSVPLFIDNAEGINKIRETASQIITLTVSNDPELRVTSRAA